jgi:hypothetical protein
MLTERLGGSVTSPLQDSQTLYIAVAWPATVSGISSLADDALIEGRETDGMKSGGNALR